MDMTAHAATLHTGPSFGLTFKGVCFVISGDWRDLCELPNGTRMRDELWPQLRAAIGQTRQHPREVLGTIPPASTQRMKKRRKRKREYERKMTEDKDKKKKTK